MGGRPVSQNSIELCHRERCDQVVPIKMGRAPRLFLFVMSISLFFFSGTLRANFKPFEIVDVQLKGLQRISAGSVFNIMPVGIGDTADAFLVQQLIRSLFASGYFKDVRIAGDDGALVISLVERAAIESIEIDGNKAIKSEALLEGLSDQGLKEGEIFRQTTLERVGLELQRQYVAQGRYGVSIDTKIDQLPRNRVDLKIIIDEGENAVIRHINIVGAESFSQEELLKQFELQHPSLLSFYKNDDKYAREKLGGDLESLESFYRNQGYADFKLKSTEVSITPDLEQVYISIGVDEGDIYKVGDVSMLGELGDIEKENLMRLLVVSEGQTFSQARVTASEERLTNILGNSGYTFATAKGVPKINEDGTVDLQFYVEAGQRAYVRRISFSGNSLTQDEVMRRELRQMEGGWASTAQIDLTKRRLDRLGYFKKVEVDTAPVPGTDNQIDVEFTVEEQPSGSISGTLAYSQGFGLMLGANYSQTNVHGTGNNLSFGINSSQHQKTANFSYQNPFFTVDGISRGFNLYFRELDFDEANIARFATDSAGLGVNFGFPINEAESIQFGMAIDKTRITQGFSASEETRTFIDSNGTDSLNLKGSLSWARSTLNRGLFPDRGSYNRLGFQFSVPGSDVEYFKLSYSGEAYFPLSDALTIRLKTELGYGSGYRNNEYLPFYEYFYSGGAGSVRGYEANSLGPRSTVLQYDNIGRLVVDENGSPVYLSTVANSDPIGGNMQLEMSAEIIFPMPLIEDQSQLRSVFFIDGGNVFNSKCSPYARECSDFDFGEIRYAVGLGITWLTGFGPMSFAISKPFQSQELDDEESFQFEIGRTF